MKRGWISRLLSVAALAIVLSAPALLPVVFAGSSGGSKGVIDQGTNGFRLTLTSATPVTTADVTGVNARTLYLTPFTSNRISLYSGSVWESVESAEVSLALGTVVANTNYDVFTYNNSGTLTIDTLVAWTNGTTRATALVRQDGVWCKTGDLTRRYVGTIRSVGNTTDTEDSEANRFVYNAQNRVPRILRYNDNTNHVYDTATARQWNANADAEIEFVLGLAESLFDVLVSFQAQHSAAGGYLFAGMAIDSTTTIDNLPSAMNMHRAATYLNATYIHKYAPAVGYHYIAAVEQPGTGATTTWDQVNMIATIGM